MKPNLKVFLLISGTLISLLVYDFFTTRFKDIGLKPLYLIKSISQSDLQLDDLAISDADTLLKDSTSLSDKSSTLIAHNPYKSLGILQDSSTGLFEEFSPKGKNLKCLSDALSKENLDSTQVRIAYFGDSFIEGDILTSDLRDTLQSVFGGEGVGIVPLYSPIAGFRKSIWSTSEGFTVSSVQEKKAKTKIGIIGQSFRVDSTDGYVQYVVKEPIPVGNFCIYYNTKKDIAFKLKVGNTPENIDTLSENETLGVWKQEFKPIHRFTLKIPTNKNLVLYGASFESPYGLQVDNFSLRGNPGYGILNINDELMYAFGQSLNYKLIVVHFGLNVSSDNSREYKFYIEPMKKVIYKLKKNFPDCAILIASVSDRSQSIEGEMQTMPSIPYLVRAQRKLAAETECLFWNVYQTMGGRNSMVNWVKAKPALANKDFTHINFAGGKKLGRALAKLIINAQKDYEKNRGAIPNDTLGTGN
jgi:hypothetical protein